LLRAAIFAGVLALELPSIGSTRSRTPTCSAIHAVLVQAQNSDRGLSMLRTALRSVDFDGYGINTIKRDQAIDTLVGLSEKVEASSALAEPELARLRAEAGAANDPARKQEFSAFADALAATLDRQKLAAVDAAKEMRRVQQRMMVADARGDRSGALKTLGGAQLPDDAWSPSPAPTGISGNAAWEGPWNTAVRRIAVMLDGRNDEIRTSEAAAVAHSTVPAAGC
jgi:hypothetical protein